MTDKQNSDAPKNSNRKFIWIGVITTVVVVVSAAVYGIFQVIAYVETELDRHGITDALKTVYKVVETLKNTADSLNQYGDCFVYNFLELPDQPKSVNLSCLGSDDAGSAHIITFVCNQTPEIRITVQLGGQIGTGAKTAVVYQFDDGDINSDQWKSTTSILGPSVVNRELYKALLAGAAKSKLLKYQVNETKGSLQLKSVQQALGDYKKRCEIFIK